MQGAFKRVGSVALEDIAQQREDAFSGAQGDLHTLPSQVAKIYPSDLEENVSAMR